MSEGAGRVSADMKPKGKGKKPGKSKKTAKARRNLSLPEVSSPPGSAGSTDAAGAGPSLGSGRHAVAVTALYTRPQYLPFNTASSLASSGTSNFRPKPRVIPRTGTELLQHQRRAPVPSSVRNFTHAVKEEMAINRGSSSQTPSSSVTRTEQKRRWTYAEARKALSLDHVDLKPKVNVNRPAARSHQAPETKKDEPNRSAVTPGFRVAAQANRRTSAPAVVVKPQRSDILKAVVDETITATTAAGIDSAQEKMKRIRFADEVLPPISKKN